MEIWAPGLLKMILLGCFTMQQGHGEKLAFLLSTANFVAPFLGAAETGPRFLITGLSEAGARNGHYLKIINIRDIFHLFS
jgi:hypothetical protein